MTSAYVARRLLQAAFSLALIVVITFLLVHISPGDAAHVIAGQDATAERVAEIRHQYGLDKPALNQFGAYVGKLLQGDLGSSFNRGPVAAAIGARLFPTLLLTGTALLISTTGGIALGMMAARKGGRLDAEVTILTLLGYALPAFWIAQLAVVVLSIKVPLFPLLGYYDARTQPTGFARTVDIGYHLLLPAFILATSEFALITRVTRAGLRRELGTGYVRAARAQGVPESGIMRYAFRNSLLSVVTVLGARVGFLLSGAVVVESIFVWPGVGSLLVEAANSKDSPMVIGLVMVASASVVVANLVTDLVYKLVDPRVRLH